MIQERFTSFRAKEEHYKAQFHAWLVRHAQGKHAHAWLGFFSFIESIFFPVPIAFFLIAVLMADVSRWVYLSLLTTVTSVLGGLGGYAVGFFLFDLIGAPLIAFYGLEDAFAQAGKLFADNAFLALFTAAFTPIPFKVFTIAGGFFKINLLTFVVASFVGRGLQFFAIGLFMRLWGKKATDLAYRYFNIGTIALVLLLIVAFLLVK
ncbi:MAG: DedA family protein [Parcubacteria group bacterium]|nr:DedA family protein [Parcubacteria group bacterium]